ncbi:hypothetical protein [Desulfovibrio sp.]|uniref:hypothetical protein n=1 Tax=Desulfovibrio sp. TaxID=885 RepID=UPI003AB0C983
MDKWIEIARTGTFTDSAGRQQTFTEKDLDAIASAYDPQKRDAPLVFGHPQTDAAPAFGWAQRLKREGGRLLAQFAQVPEQVRALVGAGHYRHVSMSLMPDRVTLRHVALLGAAQPAIDGLRAVEFSDGDDVITVDFAATPQGDTMTMEELQRQVGQLQAQIEALKTENASLKKKAEKASADFAAYREQVEGERREARVSDLVKDGKVKPADKEKVLTFAAALASQGGSVDFAAPDGKSETISLEERYLRELEARPRDQRFAEFSTPPAHAGNDQPEWTPDDMVSKM